MLLATSRFWNPEANQPDNVVVRITLYPPRNLRYAVTYCIPDLAPTYAMFKIESDDDFTALYKDRLNALGEHRIERQLAEISAAELGKTLVLCCFERVLGPDGRWIPGVLCHRRIFAKWWQTYTGTEIPELPDTGPVKVQKQKPALPLLLF